MIIPKIPLVVVPACYSRFLDCVLDDFWRGTFFEYVKFPKQGGEQGVRSSEDRSNLPVVRTGRQAQRRYPPCFKF